MAEKSTYFPDSFYRVSVKGLCVRDGKVLLVHESPALSNKWELPGGGLDFGEDIREGLKREIQEEMGLTVTSVSEKPVYVWTHHYGPNQRNIGWYYSLVLAYRIELESLNFKTSDECDDAKFFSLEELKTIELNQQTNELLNYFKPEDFI